MLVKMLLPILTALVLLLVISLIVLAKKIRFFQNREKSRQRYMEDMFHELKTPVAAIKVLADSLLSQESAEIDIYREFMKDIRAEADRENNIIRDFLSLSRLENMERHLDAAEFSVNGLLEDIVEIFTRTAAEKNVSLSLRAEQEVKICSDQRRVREILMNLVENAIKYNIEHGFVKIILYLKQGMCCIKVLDSGIGIPEKEQKKVFERFYRVKTQALHEIDGTGLGLSIVLSSVSALSGSVELESEEGKGSSFTVKIPVKPGRRKM